MVVIDENEEAMARLDMLVADYEIRGKQKLEDSEDHADNTVEPAGSPTAHWRFSAPNSSVNSRRFETEMSRGEGGEAFDGFDIALREFLAIHHPERVIAFEDTVMVRSNSPGFKFVDFWGRYNLSELCTLNFNQW